MKRFLIMTNDNCDDSELIYGLFRLQEIGDCEIDIAALTVHDVVCKHSFTVHANLSLDDVKSEDYDAIYLPGGLGPEKVRQNKNAQKVVREMYEQGKPVAAICHGPLILISAKVLPGKHATCYPGLADDLINAGALYSTDRVVVDGNLVTSRRPEDLPYFFREFVKLIESK